MRAGPDRGSASLFVLAIGLLLVAAGLAGAAVGNARYDRHRARTAADLSALAAASRAVEGPAVACAEAWRIAAANTARLAGCRVDGLEVVTVVEVTSRPLPGPPRTVSAAARAGPAHAPAGAAAPAPRAPPTAP